MNAKWGCSFAAAGSGSRVHAPFHIELIMRNYKTMQKHTSHSVPREIIIGKTFESFEEFPFDPDQDEYRPHVRRILARVFEEAELPPVLERKLNLSNRVRDPIVRAKDVLLEHGIPSETFDAVRKHICTGINLLFYDEYIETTIVQNLIPYCASKKAPKQWGLGSIFYWDSGWGRAFYSFWRQMIEKNGDTFFQAEILPRLPAKWQESYKMKKAEVYCPHQWWAMNDKEIVTVLRGLKKSYDPAATFWGIGSLPKWTGEKQEELWGKSFWSWWRTHVEHEGDEEFRRRLLPLFPPAWQQNFSQREAMLNWQNMTDSVIAALLDGLVRPYGLKKWGLGSVFSWFDPASGKSLGRSFYQHWRRSVEAEGDSEFRRRILPLLKPDLRGRYRPTGYEILFHLLTEEDRVQSEKTDDMNELHALAEQGNRAAFDRLKNLLRTYLQTTAPDCEYPEEILDRIIHMHLAVFGKIETYATVSIRNSKNRILGIQHTDTIKHARRRPADGSRVEDEAIKKIDLVKKTTSLTLFLKQEGVPSAVIASLLDQLLDGASLTVLIKNSETEIARAAKLVYKYRKSVT